MGVIAIKSKDEIPSEGFELEGGGEIPDADYKKMVLALMDKQASREVATAEVFGQRSG